MEAAYLKSLNVPGLWTHGTPLSQHQNLNRRLRVPRPLRVCLLRQKPRQRMENGTLQRSPLWSGP